ncbi:hypothetical protein LCGC14_0258080 [marine sediment metagenome]|uniref:Uncharacterized protein n=1 Tax=marine sediment metagenome TaxID=412755 RepID=A0A0F9U6Y1_9ZZZZ
MTTDKTIDIQDAWRQALEHHERLVLEVPRGHGATTFLLETLKYHRGYRRLLMPTEAKTENARRRGLSHGGVECITTAPPEGMRRLNLLMVDQPVYFSDPSRPPGLSAVKDGWACWAETNPTPQQVVVMATVTQLNRAALAELFPPEIYHRIRFAYTEDLEGLIQDDGRVAPFTSELWTEEKLAKRREELGARIFGRAFHVIGTKDVRLCEQCKRELEPVHVATELKVDTAVLYADNLWAIDAMVGDMTRAWVCRSTHGEPIPVDNTLEALEEWMAANLEATTWLGTRPERIPPVYPGGVKRVNAALDRLKIAAKGEG